MSLEPPLHLVTGAAIGRAEWLALRRALWPDCPEDEHDDEIDEQLADADRFGAVFACDAGGRAVGFVEVAVRSDYVNGTEGSPVAFLEGLYVAPASRRQGVARALVAAARAWAQQRGCSELASDTPLDNHLSQAVHRRLGFAETERVVYFVQPLAGPAAAPPPPPERSKPPTLGAVRLFVRDLAAALVFYRDTLELPLVAGGPAAGHLVFDVGGAQLVVETVAQDAPPDEQALVGRFSGVSLAVDDIAAAHAALRARGVAFSGAPEQQPWGGWLATLRDPAGNELQLVQAP